MQFHLNSPQKKNHALKSGAPHENCTATADVHENHAARTRRRGIIVTK